MVYCHILSGSSIMLFVFVPFHQVWRTSTSEFVRTLHGHRRGIACLQYKGQYVVSGSSDNTIRWDPAAASFIECGLAIALVFMLLQSCMLIARLCDTTGSPSAHFAQFHSMHSFTLMYSTSTTCSPSCGRIWDIECGASLRLLEGHDELVRCIRFDDRKIVSGAYDG